MIFIEGNGMVERIRIEKWRPRWPMTSVESNAHWLAVNRPRSFDW